MNRRLIQLEYLRTSQGFRQGKSSGIGLPTASPPLRNGSRGRPVSVGLKLSPFQGAPGSQPSSGRRNELGGGPDDSSGTLSGKGKVIKL